MIYIGCFLVPARVALCIKSFTAVQRSGLFLTKVSAFHLLPARVLLGSMAPLPEKSKGDNY